jgi:preprotein translocase SecE subunit
MAVAVKNMPETTSVSSSHRLAIDSLLGVVYVLGSLGLVFAGIPYAWGKLISPLGESAVSTAFGILVMVAAAIALVVYGTRLVGSHPAPGLRAGIAIGIAGALIILIFTCALGSTLEEKMGEANAGMGMGITLAVGIGLAGLGAYAFTRPQFERRLVQIDEQGWFSLTAYKRTQGQRVRRGTILGVLVLAGCGIYTLLRHNALATGPQNWQLSIPFTDGRYLILLPDVAITVPLLLAALAIWIAWRVVNFPTFADFLIATEAEVNKVSWTTRRRLIQDTIVVLATVILLTVFLFVVDQAWAFLLTKVGVIQLSPTAAQQAGPREQPW